MNTEKSGVSYEVLSPWANADPVPYRGITRRLESLDGKRIGLFRNAKRAAEPTLKVVENRLKKRFPAISFVWFSNLKPNERAVSYDINESFETWVQGVDAVIASYGD